MCEQGTSTCPGLLCQASGEAVAAAALAAWAVVGEALDTLEPDRCGRMLASIVTCCIRFAPAVHCQAMLWCIFNSTTPTSFDLTQSSTQGGKTSARCSSWLIEIA